MFDLSGISRPAHDRFRYHDLIHKKLANLIASLAIIPFFEARDRAQRQKPLTYGNRPLGQLEARVSVGAEFIPNGAATLSRAERGKTCGSHIFKRLLPSPMREKLGAFLLR